jgi:hypothetical protein
MLRYATLLPLYSPTFQPLLLCSPNASPLPSVPIAGDGAAESTLACAFLNAGKGGAAGTPPTGSWGVLFVLDSLFTGTGGLGLLTAGEAGEEEAG